MSSSPKRIFRSNLFSISSIIFLYCSNVTFTSAKTWALNQIDPANFSILKTINLSANPTCTTTELVIRENTLEFGLYEFSLRVDVSFDGGTNSSSTQTYVQIIPSGLAVFALENGVSGRLVGSKQAFILSPSLYSFDLDNIITAEELSFVFYCSTVNATNNQRILNMQFDLKTFQSNSNLTLAREENCFAFISNKNWNSFKFKLKLL